MPSSCDSVKTRMLPRLTHSLLFLCLLLSLPAHAAPPDDPKDDEEEVAPFPAPRPKVSEAGPPSGPRVLTGKMDDEDSGGDGQARFESALSLVRGGREREAAESLVNLARELPNDDVAPEALFEAAQLYEERLGDPATAQRLYGDLRDRYPQSRLFRRAQGRHDELTLGLRSGSAALVEFNDIVATYRTAGIRRTVERLQKLLAAHPDFAMTNRALYLLGTAYREAGDESAARRTLLLLVSSRPQSQWAPRAIQVLGEILFARGDYAAARSRYGELRAYGGPLWTSAADEGIAQCDRAQRRSRLALLATAYLLLLLVFLAYRGRRHLLPPPFEVYYYVPVAAFLLLVAYLNGGGPVGRTVLSLGLGGAALSWLSAAAAIARAADPRARTLPRTLLAVLSRTLAAAALLYVVIYHSGLTEVVLETLRNGPETG